jgi:hypothetical protein
MGERQQRLTRSKQRCMGVARQPMKLSGLFFEQRGPINYVE